MYEWLENEISSVKTPGFHVVDGPAGEEMKNAIMRTTIPVPISYVEFVLKFGNARLYRDPRGDAFAIGVFAAPRERALENDASLYHLGFRDSASVYVKESNDQATFAIYEHESGDEDRVADDFELWIKDSCERARRRFSREDWENIQRGPLPFSTSEEEVIKARRSMKWRVVGIDPDGMHMIEVTNSGERILPILKIGARSRDQRLNGAVLLRTEGLGPGQSKVLHVNCYRNLVLPHELELFSLPDPKPEDRLRYPEFGYTESRS